jgi:hypothetical protein
MVDTRAERICDTVVWIPSKVTMPTASSVDLVIAGAKDIVPAFQNPSPGSPLAPLLDSEVAVLKSLSDILLNRSDSDQLQQTSAPAPTPTVPPGFGPLSRVAPPLPEVGPPAHEVPQVNPLPTSPSIANHKPLADNVPIDPSASILDKSTLLPMTSIPVHPLPHL